MAIARTDTRLSAGQRGAWRSLLQRPAAWLAVITVCAAALRLYRLAGPVLRWDEGWSVAHASLPWAQLWRVATEEWHPPAYVALLKLWLAAGKDPWTVRFLSVLLGVAAVPLAYRVALEWAGRRRTAILAAAMVAWLPLLVYYSQVARMYAPAALAVLGAALFLLRGERAPSWGNDLGLVACAALALYTLYPTAWALAGLWLYAAISCPRRIPRLLPLGLAAILAYVPWLLAARVTIQARVGAGSPLGADAIRETIALLRPALDALVFDYGVKPFASVVLWLVLLAGVVAGCSSKAGAKKLLLPLLVLGLSVVGVAYGARGYWLAARHLVPACAFLGLALAWALDHLGQRFWPLLPAALVALAVAFWPASSGTVYAKMLEVTAPFDPSADYRYLAARAAPGDLVYFNVLARAGWYESLRGARDPGWSYAMRWDPIVEPMARIASRIRGDSASHRRLWFVIYKGDYGTNKGLVNWLDANLYPAGSEYQEDVLYAACVAPGVAWQGGARDDAFEMGIRLLEARWNADPRAGGDVALELTWSAQAPLTGDYKVFVHAVDDAGQVLAQHDAVPGTGARPAGSWQPGERIADRHALFLRSSLPAGARLHLRVGLYDAQTGRRVPLLAGGDSLEVCTLELP